MPGATSGKSCEKVFDLRQRAAFSASQAMSIAITVVLPAPVASSWATRKRSGIPASMGAPSEVGTTSLPALIRSGNRRPRLPALGATSVSQIAAPTASRWQKNGRIAR